MPPCIRKGLIMIKLKDLEWTPTWTSRIGCMHGCCEYLDLGLSLPEVFGGTGHAFIINVHDQLCPSGPTAWKTEMLFDLSPNIGLTHDVIFGFKGDGNFKELQMNSWKFVRDALDLGNPCYGWELRVPEFYVINGYDDNGYYVSGPAVGEGDVVVPWEFLDQSGIGVAEFCSCRRCEPVPYRKILLDALSAVIKHNDNISDWILDGYRSGPQAFRIWAEATERKEELPWGAAYNAEVWLECRQNGVLFLEGIAERFDPDTRKRIRESADLYSTVSRNLETVKAVYPFTGPEIDPEVSHTDRSAASAALLKCYDAESEAVDSIRELIVNLS